MRKYGILLAVLMAGCSVGFAPEEEQGQGKIVGTITDDPGGDAVDGAEVTVRDPGTTQFAIVAGGTYEATRLLPGTYFVRIRPPSGYGLAPGTLNDVPVTIEGEETDTVNFRLRSLSSSSTSVPPQARN